jgi:ribonuclease BN (tRNA processing enzyme)
LEIKFIGTGSGKASLHRYHSSFIILSEKFNLLVDAGDGISKALLASKIAFDQIDGILFSHLHPDHYSGIATLIIQMKLINRTKALRLFIHKELSATLKNYIYSSYLFNERMDFEIKYEEFDHNQEINVSDEINYISRQNSHLDQYIEYDKEKKLSFVCSSFLLKLGHKNVLYTGDIGSGKDLYLFKDHKIQMMICETTHLEMQDLLNALKRLGGYKVLLTHLDDEAQSKLAEWKGLVSEQIRDKFIIAYDDLSVPI